VDELEKALRAALQRESAPERFLDRVLLQANLRPVPGTAWWRLPVVRCSVAGVVAVACIAGGGVSENRRQERMRGEQARQQVLRALRITGTELRAVQRQIVRTSDTNRTGDQQ
jgi:hypothetical protein